MPGGGIINIGARNTIIKSKGALPLPKGNYVEIMVKDCGIGIPKEYLGRIFDPYFTTKQKGSGLGLATSYAVITKHGGHIDVESVLGVGSTFRIYLPASPDRVSTIEATADERIEPGNGTALVMDDDSAVRSVAGGMLTHLGYEVSYARDGAEAIEKYTTAQRAGRPFDVVIMDLTIPGGMGGQEAVRKLREIDPAAKAVVSSGYSRDQVMSDYRRYGFVACIAKPYRIEEFSRVLRRVTSPTSGSSGTAEHEVSATHSGDHPE